MNDIKKSEDFLDRMKGFLDNSKKQGNVMVRVEDIENAFSELIESEDDRIRKELISFLEGFYANKNRGRWIAWLEKQKTSEEAMKYLKETHSPSEMSDFQAAMNIAVAKAYDKGMKDGIEKQSEKPRYNIGDVLCDKLCTTLNKDAQPNYEIIDIKNGMYICDKCSFPISQQDEYELVAKKIEPKFKIGDWITNGDYIWTVAGVTVLNYVLRSQDGNIVDDTISHVDEQFHLWTIQDAKSGDVLTDNTIVLIVDHLGTFENRPIIYSWYFADSNKFFGVGPSESDRWEVEGFHPATKEQRDHLFSKMKEAGYTFDFEKKELKKIDQNPTDNIEPEFKIGDWIVRNGTTNGPIQIVSYEERDDGTIVWFSNDTGTYIEFLENYHKWTIQDAKDGDVLVDSYSKDVITILYKGIYKERSILAHCGWNGYDLSIKTDGLGYGGLDNTNYVPATKEQRDLLFTKMKEAGYEWDANKKELKKIEQNLGEKPKFEIDDWVVSNVYNSTDLIHIIDIDDTNYEIETQLGNTGVPSISYINRNFHLWTIQDAKDGDVLYSKAGETEFFIILKDISKNGHINSYCRYNDLCGFGVDIPNVMSISNNPTPATKEQYDLLFTKMKEAGYEWDAEKKELKKIEQNLTDKIESKFHEGEWIMIDKPCQIENISKHGYYIVKYCDDEETSILSRKFCETYFHLWSIQDAKDGDVLYCKSDYGTEFIVMSKGINNYNNIDSYFRYNSDDGFGIDIPSVFSGKQDNITPATKEQCDFLFQKMREAGYEWDADKKEIKKIENEIEIPFGAKDSELQEVTYYIPEGFHAEINDNKVLIKKGEKSTTWSEEDEKILKNLIEYFEVIDVHLQYPDKQVIDWLKSFKQRLFSSGQS